MEEPRLRLILLARKIQEALADYDRAIALSPEAPDPHLNCGAVYESLARFEEALVDYDVVL